MRISKFYGLAIYNSKAEYVGIVNDVVLDFDSGEIFGLAVGQESGVQNVAVPFKDVMAVADIIIVRSRSQE